MLTDFGNINNMTKNQFQKGIDYYKNKIKMMEEDASIAETTKAWFIERYNERLTFLENTFAELQTTINRARLSGSLVDENTATFNSLGSSVSSSGTEFSNLAQNQRKHQVSQRWKILGACLLPVVGTIPFLISWKRAKKRFKDINKNLTQENNDLDAFVANTRRPYEATLLTATKFTDDEKRALLEDTAELTRIQTLALSGTISPIEKANLTKKLVELREYAQKNGYNVSAILTDAAFKTKADKNTDKAAAHNSAFAGIPATATTLKDAYDAIKKLETLKSEVQSLYNETKDKSLETLLTNIDSRIATLRANAKTAIENGINDVVRNVDGVTAATSDDAGYTAAIAAVNSTAAAANAHFGAGITATAAKKMAEEIGFDEQSAEYKKFDEIESKRAEKASDFDTKLQKVKSEAGLRQSIADNLAALNNVMTTKLDTLTPITEINIKEAFIYFNEAKSAYDYLNQNIANLNSTEKSTFNTLRTRYLAHETTLTTSNQTFASKAENFDAYKTDINTAIDASKDKDTLAGELELLKNTLIVLESAEYKEKMNKIGLARELSVLITKAKSKISAYEALIKKKETEAENTAHNLEVKAILDENKLILDAIPATLPNDLIELENYEQQVNGAISALAGISGTLDATNTTNLRTLKQNAQKTLVAIKKQVQLIKKPQELEAYFKGEIEKVETEVGVWIAKLNTAKTKAQALNQLGICVAKLQRLKADASSKGVTLDFDSLISSITDTITNNAPTSSHS